MTRKMDLDRTGLTFTRSWFLNRNLQTFREHVYPEWAGKPIVYLELGVFEGMSLCWMLQHVLTHPDARAVGIDPWLETTKLDGNVMEQVKDRAFHNTDRWFLQDYQERISSGRQPKCSLYRANSAEALRKMCGRGGFAGITKGSVDVCMVDGNHNALAVLDDLRLVHKLVRPGGWIMLDDVENDVPKQDHVKQGLAMWLAETEGRAAEMVVKHRYMEIYRRL